MTRRQALTDALSERVEALLVTRLVNIRYLTGFTGSNAAALVRRDGSCVLATDGRYAEQAAGEAPDVEVLVVRACAPALVERAGSEGIARLGIERHDVTLAANDALLSAAGAAVELVDGGQPVERLRVVKDEVEIRALEAACRMTDEVFSAALAVLRPGVTEQDLSWFLRGEMHARGGQPGFESIVAFGPHSARPHHHPTDRALAPGDLVKLDFGAEVDGYHADMTRTVVLGPAADWQRDLHDLVRTVQEDARAATLPGAAPVDLDAVVRQRIEAAGHECAHGLGHGVGLEIHESPFLVPGSTADTLVERVPVTVEPGVYLPGRGGVRIEDTVVVRAGGARPLTTSPRELIEI